MPADLEKLAAILNRARLAQTAWAALPIRERPRAYRASAGNACEAILPLAEIVAREIGKTRFEALAAEVLPSAECCAFLCRQAEIILAPRRESQQGIMPFSGGAVVRHVPWGVVAVLVPWNYPLFMCSSSVPLALAAGNAVALKASPRAKETIAAFGQWLHDAGIPPDLAPVLDSSDDMGRALVASPLIDRIVFTGSSKTGRSVLTAAAQNLVPATVELSGCDAVFVLRDADLKLAAAAVAFGLRLNAGRTCICPRRLFVEEPVAAEFIALLSAKLASAKLLASMDPQTLREADELARKLAAIPGVKPLHPRALGEKEQALVYSGGPEALAAVQGCFLPALVVTTVKDSAEALRLDAASPYALGASIFARDPAAVAAIADHLRAGMIAINECMVPAGEAALPFGGANESGFGVRSGAEGLLEMTRPQTVAFARGTFRPHHDAADEAEDFLLAPIAARGIARASARG